MRIARKKVIGLIVCKLDHIRAMGIHQINLRETILVSFKGDALPIR
jgi:hypothetical protein